MGLSLPWCNPQAWAPRGWGGRVNLYVTSEWQGWWGGPANGMVRLEDEASQSPCSLPFPSPGRSRVYWLLFWTWQELCFSLELPSPQLHCCLSALPLETTVLLSFSSASVCLTSDTWHQVSVAPVSVSRPWWLPHLCSKCPHLWPSGRHPLFSHSIPTSVYGDTRGFLPLWGSATPPRATRQRSRRWAVRGGRW